MPVLTVFLLALALSFLPAQLVDASPSAALKQYLAPLECVKDTVNNGVSVQLILSPEECRLYNQPPSTNSPSVIVDPTAPLWSHFQLTPLPTTPSLSPVPPPTPVKTLPVTDITSTRPSDANTTLWWLIAGSAIGLFSVVAVAGYAYFPKKRPW